MAALIYPESAGEYGDDFRKIPYILSSDGEYLDGFNFYLQDRLSGRIDHTGATRTVFDQPSDDLVKSVSYGLLDAVNWLEWFRNHPDEPVPRWADARPWHFRYLYSQSMLKGYWSQEFWASGNPTPLSPSRTIIPRVNEICSCYGFMAREGLIQEWSDGPDGIEIWARAWNSVQKSFLTALPIDLRQPRPRVYNKRKSPAKTSPPLPDHLKEFFKCFDREVCFRAARLIFTAGFRIEEVTTQTLVPGTIHQRNPDEHPSLFPRLPYLLRHDPGDDRMIGVMPTLETAFGDADSICEYRVVGKGPKIRSVPVPHAEMRALWKHRDKICPITENGPSHFLLNSNLQPLSVSSLSTAILAASRKASERLGIQLNLTAHILRHAFACRFIEAAIVGQAEQAGIGLPNLTPEQITSFGQGPILTLQDILGHEWTETTEIYLEHLKGGIMAFIYTRAFNKQIDGVEWDNDLAE